MFTGIIAAIGHLQKTQAKGGDLQLQLSTKTLDLSDISLGDSVAVNGVCLTVVDKDNSSLSFDVSRESLDRTSLGHLEIGASVNLEKALAVGDRLGGHFVSGHVDGLAAIISKQESARSVIFRIKIPTGLERYIAEKGSVCIDGTSLTVNNVIDNWFEVNVIPHTMQQTIMSDYRIGTEVNLEVDLIARYLERLLPQQDSGITHQTLIENGFIK
ncbi:MAG: riboflavin synthase [Methylophaga sp.]|nr:MAG: riboflavin synthase [Methylophaga sp.]